MMETKKRSDAEIALDDLYAIHNVVIHAAEIRNSMECLESDLKRHYNGCDEVIATLDEAQEKIREVHRYLVAQQRLQRNSVKSYMKNVSDED